MLDVKLPKGLVGKNYVNASNKASTLALVDGYDYFVPAEFFFASTISYTREVPTDSLPTFSTICLPFAPTKVTVDGEEVKWKTSEQDSLGASSSRGRWSSEWLSDSGQLCWKALPRTW